MLAAEHCEPKCANGILRQHLAQPVWQLRVRIGAQPFELPPLQ